MNRTHSPISGFTIVEMVITIVILAIALAGVAAMVSMGSSNSAETLLETRATALAYSYLDEIRGRRFDERADRSGLRPCFGLSPDTPIAPRPLCSPASRFGSGLSTPVAAGDSGETLRDDFDDVDDYHLLKEGDGFDIPILDAQGNTRPEYENFSVEISVRYAGTDSAIGMAHLTYAKLITVTVANRSNSISWQFSMYKGNY